MRLRGDAGNRLDMEKPEERPRNKSCFLTEKHLPQRVKVSLKHLPTNKNLKLKRTSFITLSVFHINQFSKKKKKYLPGTDILFMVQYIQI